MARKTKLVLEPSIQEMALKHLMVHPNDKSGGILSKMRRRYGKKQTEVAIKNAQELAKLLGVNLGNQKVKFSPGAVQKLQGKKITFSIMDDIT